MRLWSIAGNTQKLDGGAMFGNAPRPMWERWSPPDERNRIDLACRALLVETDGRRILFEAGIGAFFAPDLRERYGVTESAHVLLASLAGAGFTDADIDAVVLSHLHFDHAGGLLSRYEDGPLRLLFPNARYFVGATAWERALRPHARDRASFIPVLHDLLLASGRLVVLEGDTHPDLPGIRFHLSEGHTPGLLLAEIAAAGGPIVFAADLIPGVPWVHVPVTMGYDRFPERLIDEKDRLLHDLHSRGGRLFFTHDPHTALATVTRDDRGRYGVRDPRSTLVAASG